MCEVCGTLEYTVVFQGAAHKIFGVCACRVFASATPPCPRRLTSDLYRLRAPRRLPPPLPSWPPVQSSNPMASNKLEENDFESGGVQTFGAVEQVEHPERTMNATQQAKKKRAGLGVVALAMGVVAAVVIDMALSSPTINQEKSRARTVELWLDRVSVVASARNITHMTKLTAHRRRPPSSDRRFRRPTAR